MPTKSHKKKPAPVSPPASPEGLAPEIVVGESVPDGSLLTKHLGAIRQKEVEREFRRQEAAAEIARYRWQIAETAHRLEDGVSKLNFESHPFQKGIYKDDALDLVVYGSTQWGKTEYLIVDMAASAGYGLKVRVVISKMEKRNKFVAGRLDPCFGSVPIYQEMMKAAASRNAIADSTQLKHFGPGSINLIAAKSKSDFTSYAADKCQIDEHQECDLNNIKLVDDRLSGSWFGGLVRVGHPTTAGTEINQNLDWLYHQSDQRVWKVPCDECGKYQVLTWWNHVVIEERHKGAVLSVRPRDGEWRPGNKFDIRPVCEECHRPMDRLHREGVWEPQRPGIARHGYKLSNLYNANKRLDEQLARYSAARHSARDMQEFVNKQLGEPWDMDGSKISESMLLDCAAGTATGILPYRFVPASHFEWRKEHAA